MSDLIGRRGGEGGQGWSWNVGAAPPPEPPRPPNRWVPMLLPAAAPLLLVGLVILLAWLFRSGHGERASVLGGLVAPSPQPGVAPARVRLAQWADLLQRWQDGALDSDNSAYHEGEAVPFMLRIDGLQPGATVTLSLRYDCLQDGTNLYDFLTDYDRSRGTSPVLAPDGPGRAEPDSEIPIPDDLSITLVEGQGVRRLRAWGATILVPSGGLSPPTSCVAGDDRPAQRQMDVQIEARESTAWLLWGAHLASSQDWGPQKGAASLGAPLRLALDAPALEISRLEVRVDAVLPPAPPTAVPTPTPTLKPTLTPTLKPTFTPMLTPTLTPTQTPTPPPLADLAVTTVDAPDPVAAGNNISYFVTVSNLGGVTATAVALTNTFSVGVFLIAAAPSQGSCSLATCQLGDIPPGASAIVSLTIRPAASQAGSLSHTACASTPTAQSDTANDCHTEATGIR
ncbi:MAG: DUF11 domain-containing protein [Chloroflexi bacterium]|nr:DUF11 domain-containing protein [Chloroflexota bacterium]